MALANLILSDVLAAQSSDVLANIGVTRLGNDDHYWRSEGYAFRLHDGATVTTFPLVLNPTSIMKNHPFSVELTPTQEGGVIAEENGVIISELTIQGHTGVGLRENKGNGGNGSPIPLSGQAHFLWLQDACFFRYSELQKDPARRRNVYMTFHNFKDGEHWIVVPRAWRLDRTTARRTMYPYSIQLAIVGAVENPPTALSADNTILARMQNGAAQVASATATLQAQLEDYVGVTNAANGVFTASVGYLAQVSEVTGPNVLSLLMQTNAVAGAVNEYLRGVTSFINLPVTAVNLLNGEIDVVLATLDRAESLPIEVSDSLLSLIDGLNKLASYPEKFAQDFNVRAQSFLQLIAGPSGRPNEEVLLSADSVVNQAPTLESTALTAGTQTRIRAGLFELDTTFEAYTGFREVVIPFGFTLSALAARELGDARRWLDIALANDLRAPYISDEGLPGTLRPGQPCLIPTTDPTPPIAQVRSAGDPELGKSQLDELLGRDFALEVQPDGTYDFIVDPSTLTDFVTVAGLFNLEQATSSILSTEKGQNVLYQQVGYDRIIGKPGSIERIVEARVSVVAAVQRDPRVSRVRNATFSAVEDRLDVTLDVVAIDASAQRVVGRIFS